MALVIPPNTSRDTSDPNLFSDVYDNDAAIIDEVNGNLDNANIAPAASIALSKLAQGAAGAVGLVAGAVELGQQGTQATGDTSIGTSDTDIAGATLTVGANGTYLGFGVVDFSLVPDAQGDSTVIGNLVVNGVTQPAAAILAGSVFADAGTTAHSVRATVAQIWGFSATAGMIAKLIAHRVDSAGTGAATAIAASTSLRILKLS